MGKRVTKKKHKNLPWQFICEDGPFHMRTEKMTISEINFSGILSA